MPSNNWIFYEASNYFVSDWVFPRIERPTHLSRYLIGVDGDLGCGCKVCTWARMKPCLDHEDYGADPGCLLCGVEETK